MIYDQYIQNLKKLAGTRKSQSRERGGPPRVNPKIGAARDRSTRSQRQQVPGRQAASQSKIVQQFGFNAAMNNDVNIS